MENIITKTQIICVDDKNYTLYSFNDGEHKYVFFVNGNWTIRNNNRIYQGYLDIYEGIDGWYSQWKEYHRPSFDNESKKIDWISYRSDKLNYPDLDPFTNEFKRYAQSIVKLQAFC